MMIFPSLLGRDRENRNAAPDSRRGGVFAFAVFSFLYVVRIFCLCSAYRRHNGSFKLPASAL